MRPAVGGQFSSLLNVLSFPYTANPRISDPQYSSDDTWSSSSSSSSDDASDFGDSSRGSGNSGGSPWWLIHWLEGQMYTSRSNSGGSSGSTGASVSEDNSSSSDDRTRPQPLTPPGGETTPGAHAQERPSNIQEGEASTSAGGDHDGAQPRHVFWQVKVASPNDDSSEDDSGDSGSPVPAKKRRRDDQ